MSIERPATEDPEANKPDLLKAPPIEDQKISLEPLPYRIGSVHTENSNVKHCGATETELYSLLNSGDNFSICLSATMVFVGIFISTGIQWAIAETITDVQKGVYPTLMLCSFVAFCIFAYLAKTLKNPSKELIRKIVANEPR